MVSDKKKHTINKKLGEKKLFIYVVFTYRKREEKKRREKKSK